MFTIFTLFKFLHVASVILWLGGVCTLTILNLRLTRTQDNGLLLALLQQSNFYGKAIIGPASALTLIAGIVTAVNVGYPFSALWISWGFMAIFASVILGATLLRSVNGQLLALAPLAKPGEPRLRALQQRLGALNLINFLLLLSAVGAMVFKPSL
jgi:uncharacterized membrane protein